MKKFLKDVLIFDTETTGTDVEIDDIIEFSATVLEGNELFNYTTLVNTEANIAPEASAVHFIDKKKLRNEPTFLEVHENISALFNSYKYYVGHNVEFDRTMLIASYFKNIGEESIPEVLFDTTKFIDTYVLAKHLYSQDETVTNLKLGYLWFRFGLNEICDKEIVPHKAEDDVYMCLELLKYLINECFLRGIVDETGDIAEQIIKYCSEPITYLKMPWGKHKNTLITELDTSYLEWLIKSSDVLDETKNTYDADLAYTIGNEYVERLEKMKGIME